MKEKNKKKWDRKKLLRLVQIELILLVIVLIALGLFLYKDYNERPGFLDWGTLKATERTTDSIALKWKSSRNTEIYNVFYKEKNAPAGEWEKAIVKSSDGTEPEITLEGLEEGVKYAVVLRPDSADRKGFKTSAKYFTTRKSQKIKARTLMTKLTCNKPFKLKAKAKTALHYKSSDPDIAEVDPDKGTVTPKSSGEVIIRITAEETKDYMPAKKKVRIIVIEAEATNPSSSSARIIYSLDEDDCEAVMAISGAGGASTPQSLAYTGDKYIIAYGSSSVQRIVTYDADGNNKSVRAPGVGMGHPNGFTYCNDNGVCYSVRGWTGKTVSYAVESGVFSSLNLRYGCSGIAYDRVDKVFYTSARNAMRVYSGDGNFSHMSAISNVKHSSHVYTQDCGGHAGILMHCLSGSSKHGTNYIDLYNMREGTYLGTISCDLSEVESVIVDDEGYLEIMSNYTTSVDYIWKTRINIEDIGEE